MTTIVTAASSNHYKSARQFLNSCPKDARVFFYDIGLTDEEAEELIYDFPEINYRVLDFSKLPAFAQLSAPCAGAYAWKPYIINEIYDEVKQGIVLWCDAGNVIKDIDAVKWVTYKCGIYTPYSAGTIEEWTHIAALRLLRVPPTIWSAPMRNAAIVSVVANDEKIREFLRVWKDHSLTQEIAIPEGSTRKNHRWDQSILSCLFYLWDVRSTGEMYGILTHQDCDNDYESVPKLDLDSLKLKRHPLTNSALFQKSK